MLWLMMWLEPEVKDSNQSLFVFARPECFGNASSVAKNTQCSLWVDISDKARIKLRFAFQVFCSVEASWISRRRRKLPNVDKFSAHHFENMQISSEGYEIVMQFAWIIIIGHCGADNSVIERSELF